MGTHGSSHLTASPEHVRPFGGQTVYLRGRPSDSAVRQPLAPPVVCSPHGRMLDGTWLLPGLQEGPSWRASHLDLCSLPVHLSGYGEGHRQGGHRRGGPR
eukprot:1847792-Heterocapsa_arctica.AAC.1